MLQHLCDLCLLMIMQSAYSNSISYFRPTLHTYIPEFGSLVFTWSLAMAHFALFLSDETLPYVDMWTPTMT